MKIAIVGTSKLTHDEEKKAALAIENIVIQKSPREIITGDADGIDALARSLTQFDLTVIKATDNKWEGKRGYKARNIMIAEMADYIYSISTKKIKDKRCYHCDTPNHERTGGCWTKRFAFDKLKKPGETIVI